MVTSERAEPILAVVELPKYIVDDISTVLSWAAGIIGVVCMAKIIFVGARMAWDQKQNPGIESPTAAEFLAALVGWILAGTAATAIAVVLIQAGRVPENSAPDPATPDLVNQIEEKYPPLTEEN